MDVVPVTNVVCVVEPNVPLATPSPFLVGTPSKGSNPGGLLETQILDTPFTPTLVQTATLTDGITTSPGNNPPVVAMAQLLANLSKAHPGSERSPEKARETQETTGNAPEDAFAGITQDLIGGVGATTGVSATAPV